MRLENAIQKLKTNSLQQLNLWGNDIGNKGAEHLAEALKVNTSLQKLDLWGNKLRSKGVEYLAETLKVNTSLQFLDLGFNNIGEEFRNRVSLLLERNRRLKKHQDMELKDIAAKWVKINIPKKDRGVLPLEVIELINKN